MITPINGEKRTTVLGESEPYHNHNSENEGRSFCCFRRALVSPSADRSVVTCLVFQRGHSEETKYETDGKSAGVASSWKLLGPATTIGARGGDNLASRSFS